MKDKELRKLLADRGLIYESEIGAPPSGDYTSFNRAEVASLEHEVEESARAIRVLGDWLNETRDENIRLSGRIYDLNAKFDAINKHYGISVEKQEAQYVVKEGE